jgi:hypothetical protein
VAGRIRRRAGACIQEEVTGAGDGLVESLRIVGDRDAMLFMAAHCRPARDLPAELVVNPGAVPGWCDNEQDARKLIGWWDRHLLGGRVSTTRLPLRVPAAGLVDQAGKVWYESVAPRAPEWQARRREGTPVKMREGLNRPMRWAVAGLYGGLGLFLAGILAGAAIGDLPILAVSLPGFAVAFVVGVMIQFVWFRCQRCSGNLAPLIMQRPRWSVDPRLRFCPYCGCELDEELPPQGPAGLNPGAQLGTSRGRPRD